MTRGRTTAVRILLVLLTVATIAETCLVLLTRYREFNNGWSWDLAYYNQWFRSLVMGIGQISVRPSSAYGREGLSVWISNYLAPIRFLIAPFYAMRPGPESLLATAALFAGLTVPAAYLLARGESGSETKALGVAILAMLTPLMEPLRNNDFRELQLAIPFMIAAVEGARSGSRLWTIVGVGGTLACRQELAVFAAMLGLIPPRFPLDRDAGLHRVARFYLIGVGWFAVFLLYLRLSHGPYVVTGFLRQFVAPGPGAGERLVTSANVWIAGLGAWGVASVFAPRAALVAFPWIWSLAAGRWSMGMLATESWHHVRYAAPLAGVGIAAGIIGLIRLDRSCDRLAPRSRILARLVLWTVAAAGSAYARHEAATLLAQAPRPLSLAEAEQLRPIIERIGPEEVVMTDYRVSAHLSSRRYLWSDVLNTDAPRYWPNAGPEFGWIFHERGRIAPGTFERQGFELIHDGSVLVHYRNSDRSRPPIMPSFHSDVVVPLAWTPIVLAILFSFPAAFPATAAVVFWIGMRCRHARRLRAVDVETGRPRIDLARAAINAAIARDAPPLVARGFLVLVWAVRMVGLTGWLILGLGLATSMMLFLIAGAIVVGIALLGAIALYPIQASAARRAAESYPAERLGDLSVARINFLLHGLFPFAEPRPPA